MIVAVGTSLAGIFLDDRSIMTAVLSIAVAGPIQVSNLSRVVCQILTLQMVIQKTKLRIGFPVCAPCFSFAMYHRGEWTSLKLPGTELTVPIPSTYRDGYDKCALGCVIPRRIYLRNLWVNILTIPALQ